LKLCDFTDLATVYARDALRFLENDERYDLIFIDPPYDTTLADKTLMKISEFDKLNTNGIIICETKADSTPTDLSPPYIKQKEYRYGGVKITRYTRLP
jgi:16S rRNA G966 N2-methylase RsmD